MRTTKIAAALVAALTLACAFGPQAAVQKTAEEACRYGLLEDVTPMLVPPSVDASTLVRDADLRYRTDEAEVQARELEEAQRELEALGGLGELGAALGELASGVTEVMEKAGPALSEGLANRTTCTVEVLSVEDGFARARVEQTTPDLSREGEAFLSKMGEINRLPTHEERVSAAEAWFDTATSTRTTTHEVELVEVEDGWRVNLKIPEQEHAKVSAKVEELTSRVTDFTSQRRELEKFKVTKARFYKTRSWYITEPVIDLEVRNGTSTAVSRVYFRGNLQSEGRSVPWVRDEFNYKIPGGLEPGEEARWRLNPNMFSEWGTVEAPSDAVLTVEVLGLDGPEEEELFSTRGEEQVAEELAEAKARAEEIAATYLGGS